MAEQPQRWTIILSEEVEIVDTAAGAVEQTDRLKEEVQKATGYRVKTKTVRSFVMDDYKHPVLPFQARHSAPGGHIPIGRARRRKGPGPSG